MSGLQIIADARAQWHLSDRGAIERWLTQAAELAGMTILGWQSWTLPSALDNGPGVSITAELVESHAAVETWPEEGIICLCFYSCHPWEPGLVMDYFKRYFGVTEMLVYQEIERFGRKGKR